MTSELLFVILVVLELAFVLLCFRYGKSYLYMAVISNIVFTNMVSGKIVTIFGLDATVANVSYAAIFLATDLLSEHYGKRYAKRAIWLGFFSLVPLVVFAPIVNLFTATTYSAQIGESLSIVFGKTARISIASAAAYIVANRFDIWWYDVIKRHLPARKWLWVRNNGSTLLSQLIDHTLFTALAFVGSVPSDVIWQIFVSGYIIKTIVALSDTPVMYLSFLFKPSDLPLSTRHPK